jgi:FAD/FMN-containing dehydrogenase
VDRNVATNAGGVCCVKYGVTGDFMIGIESVLADGQVMRTGRRTVNGVAGYDLPSLRRSKGTLGVITEMTVRLVPEPQTPHSLVASSATVGDADEVVAGVTRAGLAPSLMEILDRTTVQAVDQMSHMDLGRGRPRCCSRSAGWPCRPRSVSAMGSSTMWRLPRSRIVDLIAAVAVTSQRLGIS